MYVLICHTQVIPEKAALYEATFAKLRGTVLANEPGVVFYELTKHPETANLYVLIEAYKDETVQEEHLAKDYYQEAFAVILTCIDGGADGFGFVVHKAIDYGEAIAAPPA